MQHFSLKNLNFTIQIFPASHMTATAVIAIITTPTMIFIFPPYATM